LGNPQDQRRISLIAVHAHGIPDEFPEPVIGELDRLPDIDPAGREDLTALPLVTIDPVDARDHDDAVHAAPDSDPANPGGFVVTVAIADVAHYVRSGTRIDREAALRGNSVYFPDRVVPMLPETISNDLCSLRQGEPRPCLAVRLVIDRTGAKRRHTFLRAMMRSAAKLSYQQAQAAIDGRPDAATRPLLKGVLEPLWAAYRLLAAERDRRGPLELEVPERRVLLGEDGRVARVVVPERLEAHRLIEEMMIQANVAAAETLEALRTPCVYRVHDQPSKEKLSALQDFLESLGLKLPRGTALEPRQLNRVLAQAKSLPAAGLVNEVMLRSQAQAEYAVRNYGHFGLNLRRYAHFTSPIRRYADLLVHRGLIRALKLGAGGLPREDEAGLAERAKSISESERRAMAAERETVDRLVAAYLADRVGATFAGRVSGAVRAGLFVRLRETGADGFIPAETIGADYWRHDEARHALVGDRSGLAYQLGDEVEVRLTDVVASAGALRFEMLSPGRRLEGAPSQARRGPRRLTRMRSRRR
jgi:ribonuclease R